MKIPALVVAVAGAFLALNATGSNARKFAKAASKLTQVSVIKTDILKFHHLKNPKAVSLEEKSLIDAWLYAQRDEVNMFGDARGTKYEHGTPLKNEDGTKRNDKYAYVKWRQSDAPWLARFPKHWGKEPAQQTRDYVKLPGAYGFGSGTLKRWIEEKMAEDEAAAAKEAAAASPRRDAEKTSETTREEVVEATSAEAATEGAVETTAGEGA